MTSKSPAYKFSIHNTTEWAFAEARQFHSRPLKTNARLQLTCQQPHGNCCYWRILLAVRRPPGQWILAVQKCRLGEVSCQLLTHNVATRRREWQTTPIQHCWTWRCSVCPTGSTAVWRHLQMQWTTAVRRRCWQQPPANDMWQQVAKATAFTTGLHDCSMYVCLKWTCLCTFVNSTVESLHRRDARHWRAFLIQTQFTGSLTRRLFAFDFSSLRRCYVRFAVCRPRGLGRGELLFERNVWSIVIHL